jgi:hypothetical protein
MGDAQVASGGPEVTFDLQTASRVGADQSFSADAQHVVGFALPDGFCAGGLKQVVHACASATLIAVGDLSQLKPGDGAQQGSGLSVTTNYYDIYTAMD